MEALTTFVQTHVLQPDNTIQILGRTYRPNDIFRMVIIIGGYLLLRPYILKMQAKFQEKDHAREVDPSEESSHSAMAAKRKPAGEESDDEDDDSWGAKLRRRQRAEAAEKARLMEEENDSDDEIAEYLEKE
ncbi:hypothetical protein DFP73DRAFT_545808 [Morchella snyderi]|nr:hypothetical protein DFP73DRAFT_545808 [Morchella snyderi]